MNDFFVENVRLTQEIERLEVKKNLLTLNNRTLKCQIAELRKENETMKLALGIYKPYDESLSCIMKKFEELEKEINMFVKGESNV